MNEGLLTTPYALLYIAIQFVIYFPLGYLFLYKSMKPVPFMIRLPVFISTGMLLYCIITSIIGIFYIGNITAPIVTITSYVVVLGKLLLIDRNSLRRVTSSIFMIKVPSVVFIFASFLIIAHFSLVAGYMGWPPQGDVITHGLLTSLLINNGALQTTLSPIAASEPWLEPFGLHILAANLSVTLGIFPALSVFILGTTIIILILLLIYSTIYILTRSTIFSVIGLISGFFVSSINVEHWLIGYFYNGPYANLFGYLALLCYVTTHFGVTIVNRKKVGGVTAPSIISLVGLMLIYPPFALLPLIHLVGTKLVLAMKLIYISHLKLDIKSLKSTFIEVRNTYKSGLSFSRILLLAIPGIATLILIIFYINGNPGMAEIFSNKLTSILGTAHTIFDRIERLSFLYSLSLEDFISDLRGPMTILTTVAAVIAIIKRKWVYLSSFYLLISGMVIFAIWDLTAEYTWFILSRRIFVFLSILNWIMLLSYLSLIVRWFISKAESHASFIGKTYSPKAVAIITYAIIIIPFMIFFFPYLFSHATLDQADRWGAWFPRSEAFRNDYNLMVWIHDNIGSKDLTMVDNSFNSLFINSMSIKNLTAVPFLHGKGFEVQRSLDNLIVWERPELMRQFIEMYDVKYIVSLTSPIYRNPSVLGGNNLLYLDKYTPTQYLAMFDTMSFLEPIKSEGLATVYKVNRTDLEGKE